MLDDAYIGGRSENNIKCVVHDDLQWKNQTSRYILPRHWLYEWLSQFHSCGTYSVLSRSPSFVFILLNYAIMHVCVDVLLPEQLLITCVLNNCLVWFKVSLLYLVSLQPACVFDEIIKGQRSPHPSVTTHLSGSNNFQDFIRSFSMGSVSLCWVEEPDQWFLSPTLQIWLHASLGRYGTTFV